MLRSLLLSLVLAASSRAEDGPHSPAPAPAGPTADQLAAETMLTSAVRLLAAGRLEAFMDQHCGDCATRAARDRWRRYQLSTAARNAPYCLHGAQPGRVEVSRWQGSLEADGKAKAYLRCGGGQHADKQESRLPPPVTIEKSADGVYKITQLSI